MNAPQRIVRVRRTYNQWVANQTLEDFALRFTAKSARKWSNFRVANTALGAISFLALEAIGGSITLTYGFDNAVAAILAVSLIIFLTGVPITYYAAKYGVDIDLLTRGAGFGYIGSTVTSLIYASFTFLFFAIEAAIMSLALELCFGVPLGIGYLISAIVIVPLVTYGITLISRLQMWTQPLWIGLHLLPFIFIALNAPNSVSEWTHYAGISGNANGLTLLMFGAASSVVFSLVAQIGEQVDFVRFLPDRKTSPKRWWFAMLSAGPGWIVPGAIKMLLGSFLAVLALKHMVPASKAAEPTQMYVVAFGYVFSSSGLAIAFAGAFVIISQLKINVTNAYAGSIAWSNFFSRLTHSHPGRVVWLVFNVAIALVLMELGIYKALEHILGLYSVLAIAWVGTLVADLVINKPLGLSPSFIEFKRAHLYDINPVGVGSMILAALIGIIAFAGFAGQSAQALASFITLGVAFVSTPLVALATRSRFYIARTPKTDWGNAVEAKCTVCEHTFEVEDMASCPAYGGHICSLCCSLDARCHDCCKPNARLADQVGAGMRATFPDWLVAPLTSRLAHYLGVLATFGAVIGGALMLVYLQTTYEGRTDAEVIRTTLWAVFFILILIAGVAAWLFVLAQESRRFAEDESSRQNVLLMQEIEAHQRTDAALQRAKETAEAASQAKSRHMVGLSHELRTPLNAILGYAQLLERAKDMPSRRVDAIKVVRRSAEHLSGLIDGLLDISKIEAGRFKLNRDEVRLREFLEQLAETFRMQAAAHGIDFTLKFDGPMPAAVFTDESRLRQILFNLLANAIKFTDKGSVTLRVAYRNQVASLSVEDTGLGIKQSDLKRIFEPFERAHAPRARHRGTGLGLTITRQLVQIMGGDIDVRSEYGKGSTFRVRLFMGEVARPQPMAPPEKQVIGYRGERKTVMVVDDDPVHRDLVHEILVPLEFTVLSTRDGVEALDIADAAAPDLVLLDIQMPEINGWEVAERLRAKGHSRTAILMLSANITEAHRILTPDRAHDDYLLKPFDVRQLLGKVQALLNVEWIYEHETPITVAPMSATEGALPEKHLRDLLHLGEIGYIRGIEERLGEIETALPHHRDFTAGLRELIREFDLKEYMARLEKVLPDDAR
ncbi:autoinducer 2 sensor kinase/phosphatase LuxQ [Variibacter gotjawalensis]|uniref:histidine kinase n=1 Tax=Variibacter gotjawalensis TaxID=1333996 RepID=A0A0S3PUG9_9BRAD|nr:ATP-binding protein [Variibacter gotjawalensis]NIK49902.1 signal transduction histidine kinase/CheY-like chemotaxis protein/purine-cytosine permease-like protein [Variibacter gotjawalensis]RZS45901.1 signal transduction histidine kinase [Variibacter gotjawalensis]BAT59576.1 autoinducer 2 sensor kinase/phosphatase LuxQ [Variibacter gotjawalensis]